MYCMYLDVSDSVFGESLMHRSMHSGTCTHMHACTHTHTHTYVRAHTHAHTHMHTHTHTHACTQTHMHTHTHARTHTHTRAHKHTCTHTHTHTHTHTRTRTHTHTHNIHTHTMSTYILCISQALSVSTMWVTRPSHPSIAPLQRQASMLILCGRSGYPYTHTYVHTLPVHIPPSSTADFLADQQQ